MKRIHKNIFECESGETVTMSFIPSKEGIVKILYAKDANQDPVRLEGSKLEFKFGDEQVKLFVHYAFPMPTEDNCKIIISGSSGGEFENKPPAEYRDGPAEMRVYRFKMPQS